MKILAIGDIIGKPGRHAVRRAISEIRKEHKPDFIIANGENLAHGSGMTIATFDEMRDAGVDFFTTGNHIFKKADIFPELEKKKTRVIRPANYPPGNLGKGYEIVTVKSKKILIINLCGRVFMHQYDDPFRCVDQILALHEDEELDGILVDFHAEATSEKIAMRHYLNGRISALWGTHTHVPTADCEVTENGMAYITDIGMVGPKDSVIGVKKENAIEHFLKQTGLRLEVASGRCVFNGIMVEISGRNSAKSIELIQKLID